jgi:hypothetical protein
MRTNQEHTKARTTSCSPSTCFRCPGSSRTTSSTTGAIRIRDIVIAATTSSTAATTTAVVTYIARHTEVRNPEESVDGPTDQSPKATIPVNTGQTRVSWLTSIARRASKSTLTEWRE